MIDEAKGEPIQRCKARSERHQRTSERAVCTPPVHLFTIIPYSLLKHVCVLLPFQAEALAEKKLRDLKVQKEEAERNVIQIDSTYHLCNLVALILSSYLIGIAEALGSS